MSFRTLKLRKNPECPVCGPNPTVTELIDYDQFCGIAPPSSVGPLEVARDKAVSDLPLVDGIPQISVQELKRKLDAKEDVFVLREPHEYQIVNLGAPLIPVGEVERRASELAQKELAGKKDAEIIVHCKSGARSQRASIALKQAGFTNVSNLTGGILAWAEKIDPTLPKY
jgi:rhodanese-related sulfurtransferase